MVSTINGVSIIDKAAGRRIMKVLEKQGEYQRKGWLTLSLG